MDLLKVAVVGANGFVGSHLTNKLIQIPNIKPFLFGKNKTHNFGNDITYQQLDIKNEAEIRAYFSDIDIVYYLASETIPSSSWENPIIEIEKNLIPFLVFLENIVKLRVKKIVFISSGGTIYGATEQKVTEDSFKNPFSPHGITKLTMEYFLNYFRKKYNLNFCIYRASNVYGAGQNTKKGIGIINTFLEDILSKNKITIFGDGSNIRNFLYVDDLIEIMVLPLFADIDQSNVFNVCSNDTLTINQLVEEIRKVVKQDFEVVYTKSRQSDNSTIYLDNTRILKANPGFQMTSLKDGILKTYLHIKKENNKL